MKNIISKLGILLITLVIMFSVLEMYFKIRYTRYQQVIVSRYGPIKLCYKYNKDLIYTYKPNECGFNSHGYFDNEHTYLKPKGVTRIIIIGDSVAAGQIAAGQGGNLDESFGKVLEKKLNSSLRPKKFEVIILATNGYSTSQELILLRKEAFGYNPDLIIWSYCLNDPANQVFGNANGELGRYFYRPQIYALYYIQKKLFLILENLKAQKYKGKPYDELLHYIYWDQVERNIGEIGEISRKKRIPIVFLIHPDFEPGNKFADYSLTYLHKKLYSTALKYNLLPIDLLNCYKAYDPEEIRMRNDDPWHINAKGHAAVAEYLYAKLQEYWN